MRRWRALPIVLLLCIVVTISNVSAQTTAFQPSPHVFKIRAAGCTQGPEQRVQTGFRVKNLPGIVTALHGVAGCRTITALSGVEGIVFDQMFIGKVDISRDMALLWSEGIAINNVDGLKPIGSIASDSYIGVQVLGYPQELFGQIDTSVKIAETTVLLRILPEKAIHLVDRRGSPAIGVRVLRIEGNLQPGHSGAPLLNRNKQVIGVGNGGLDTGRVGIGWAIPWRDIVWRTVSDRLGEPVSGPDLVLLDQLKKNNPELVFSFSEASIPMIGWRPIPAGPFIMGSSEEEIQRTLTECLQAGIKPACERGWFDQELPQKTANIAVGYEITTFEITNAQYGACVRAKVCVAAKRTINSDIDFKPIFFEEEYPVVGVSFSEAERFCTWIGGRVPTEEEWEKAARGTDGRRYPWGNRYDAMRANLDSSGPVPVGSYPNGASPYGVMDMVGNAFEWTSTSINGKHLLRGGSWFTPIFRGRTSDRATKLEPNFANYDIGFRCVR
jgi:S1-C subfamily serine protease